MHLIAVFFQKVFQNLIYPINLIKTPEKYRAG